MNREIGFEVKQAEHCGNTVLCLYVEVEGNPLTLLALDSSARAALAGIRCPLHVRPVLGVDPCQERLGTELLVRETKLLGERPIHACGS